MATVASATVRRVRVLKLKKSAWEDPSALETLLTATLQPKERIVYCSPDARAQTWLLVTEE